MADGRQEPYDPYMPSTGNAQGGNARTAALQAVCTLAILIIEFITVAIWRGPRGSSSRSSECPLLLLDVARTPIPTYDAQSLC